MITAIIQARIRSTRLPGKVLLALGGKTILENVVERARQAELINRVVLATSTEAADDAIANLCSEKDIVYFRGSENDVLDRFYRAALAYKAENICRLTADCPLIDPTIIDKAAREFLSGDYDYVSTSHPVATYPDGFDTWIFSFAALEQSWREAKLPSEREHVTSYIWNHPEKFKIGSIKNKIDLSAYRLTIDEPADYEALKLVVANVADLNLENIIQFLKTNAKAKKLNANITRDAGYQKSLQEDKRFLENK